MVRMVASSRQSSRVLWFQAMPRLAKAAPCQTSPGLATMRGCRGLEPRCLPATRPCLARTRQAQPCRAEPDLAESYRTQPCGAEPCFVRAPDSNRGVCHPRSIPCLAPPIRAAPRQAFPSPARPGGTLPSPGALSADHVDREPAETIDPFITQTDCLTSPVSDTPQIVDVHHGIQQIRGRDQRPARELRPHPHHPLARHTHSGPVRIARVEVELLDVGRPVIDDRHIEIGEAQGTGDLKPLLADLPGLNEAAADIAGRHHRSPALTV